ncbi:hypothetical protein [Cellulomonas composti]|uniref:Activator of HSP90 ATPase n=1 Tax=Cellulomonas composti TaxID=266130 RepID=A0A511J7Y4_9CELL|nr:hypothetical protein [Cellulomonas composti]GEL94110.1 hypothetical protein CCO02nite_07680 [Cellulomonas composti]
MSLDRREIVSLDVAVPMATVWEHLRDTELARRWFAWDGPGYDEELHRFLVELPTEHRDVVGDATTHALSWPNHDELVLRAAAHEPGHTHLTVTRRSHEGLLDVYDGVRDVHDEDWLTSVHQLKFALEVHPGVDRRTLAVQGLDAGDRRNRLLDRAGLHGVRGIPVGGNVEVHRPDGSTLGGTLVYRTVFQFGLHLHGLTESLLVVRETPAAASPPHGQVAAVISTFGLTDEQWDEVERRWEGWWPHRGAVLGAGVPAGVVG